MEYAEKLKHPKWQKRRLEILNAANWTCQQCDCKETTLHVHHVRYKFGLEPWEYPDKDMLCLCEVCHGFYHKAKKVLSDDFSKLFQPVEIISIYESLKSLDEAKIGKDTIIFALIYLAEHPNLADELGEIARHQCSERIERDLNIKVRKT